MADIKGTIADARFEKMGLLLSDTLDSGEDVGASVCVTIDGETVVDIWGGHADEATTRHDHERLVDHQDHDLPVCAAARRARSSRLL